MSDDIENESTSRVDALLHAYRTTAEELASEHTTSEQAARLQAHLAELDLQLSGELERRNALTS